MCKHGLSRLRAGPRAEMARSLRVEYVGAYYHVMARGNRREEIFLDEDRCYS